MNRFFLSVCLFLLLVLNVRESKATHLMGVDITYTCQSACVIRIHHRVYRDCGGSSGVQLMDFDFVGAFGCTPPTQVGAWTPCNNNSSTNCWFVTEVTPVCPGTVTECQNPNSSIRGVEEYYRYGDFNICNTNCTTYNIEWWGQNRNGGITSGASNQGLGSYITTLNTGLSTCNNSPQFANPPVPYLCAGQPFTFNQGATDPDGDSLVYSLGNCVDENNTTVIYNAGFSATSPLGSSWGVTINPLTGDVSFLPAPGNIEVGVMCVYVQEWRNGVLLNTIVRDMQINVIACPNNNVPVVNSVGNIINGSGQGGSAGGIIVGTCLNNNLCFEIPVTDPNVGDTVTVWWDQSIVGGSFFQTGNPGMADTVIAPNPQVSFCWTPTTPGVFSFLVEMKDNACPNFGFSQFTVTIIVSDPQIVAIPQPPRCDTLDICAFPTGGIAPFSYQWAGQGGLSSTDSCVTHIYPGPGVYTYTLTVTDSVGCVKTITDSVLIPNIPVAVAGPDYLHCISGIDTLGQPANPNEIYSWVPATFLSDPTVSNPVLNITNPGPAVLNMTYILTVTDTTSGCSDEDTMNVTVSFPAQLTYAVDTVQCYGTPTGNIDMTVTNGLAPFSIGWSGPNGYSSTNEDIINLYSGMYYVIVQDSAGCISVDSVLITQPPSPLWANMIPRDVCCNGGADGAIETTVTGDTPPYDFSWTGPNGFTSINEDLNGLVAGTYYLSIGDSIDCEILDSVIIMEPTAVVINFNEYDAACNGDATGVIAAHLTGGHGNYSYSWTPGGFNSDSIFGLVAGSYILNAGDTCYGENTATVFYDDFEGHSPWTMNVQTGPNGVNRNFWTMTDGEAGVAPPGCATFGNGDTTLHITNLVNPNSGSQYDVGGFCGVGGSCPETNMRAESPFISTLGFTNLTLQFDFISVGDGLLDNASLWYNDGGGWTVLNPSLKSPSCAPVQGQWTPFTVALPASCNNIPNLQLAFNWTNNDDGTGNNPAIAINNVHIFGPIPQIPSVCAWADTASIGEPTPLADTMIATHLLCFGDSNGTATVFPTGGNGNYSYHWSNNGTTQMITNLLAGTYIVTVSDTAYTPAGGPAGFLICTILDTITVLEPPPLSLTPFNSPTSCFLGSDGTVSVNVTGGTPGYAYVWNTSPNPQITQTVTGLPTGSYTVIVTDTNGCRDTATTVVTQPSPVGGTLSMTNSTCGNANGTATVLAFGGAGAYTYLWSNNQQTATATGLLAGQHSVTITDANGCQGFAQIIVGNEPNPVIAIDSQTNLLCFGDTDGSATAIASGSTGPYTFNWSNGQASATATNLAAGMWYVTVTDSFGCRDTTSVNITSPPQLIGTMIMVPMGCMSTSPDGTVGVLPTGGVFPYTFQWDLNTGSQTTQMATNLAPGIYAVTVTDANGCTYVNQDTVIQTPRPDISVGPAVSFCEGEGGALIFASGSGAQPPYYYSWWCDSTNTYCGLDSINDNDPIANPDTSTWYYVYVTDFNGCRSDTDSVFVTVLPKPIVNAGEDKWICGDSAPCVILTPTITGGAPGPFTYAWSPLYGLNDSTILNPCARPDTTTIYTLIVTAGNGCTSDFTTIDTLATVTVHVNPIPVAEAGPDKDICLGDSAMLQGYGTGAGPVYGYQWTPADGLSDTTVANPWSFPPKTTIYSLVTWSNNCPSDADSVEVRVHTIPTVEAGWDREICLGETTILDAQAAGDSTAIYSFVWMDTVGVIGDNELEDIYVSPDSTTAYWVTTTTNWGCTSEPDTAVVYVKPSPIAEAGDYPTICGSDTATLYGGYYYTTTDSAPAGQIYYQWSPNVYINDTALQEPNVWPPNSQWYYLDIRYNTCHSRDSVLVTVIPEVIVSVDADTNIICGGDSVQLYSSGGIGGASFTWTPAAGLSDPNAANPVAAPDTTTTYQIVVAEGGCGDTSEVKIEVIPSPDPAYLSSLPDGCVPHVVNFIQTATEGLAYIWDFQDGSPVSNEEHPTHVFDKPGTYEVSLTVVNYGGCATEVSLITVNVIDTAHAEFSSNPDYPVEMSLPSTDVEFMNQSTGGTGYVWDFGDGIKSEDENPNHMFRDPGTYFVTLVVANDEGCHGRVTHGPYIVLSPDLFIPNVFSPNNDGINDNFLIEYTGSQPFNLQIFDRWGVMIYETRNKTKAWDGLNMKGKEAIDGVYYYRITIGDREFTGNVTLMR